MQPKLIRRFLVIVAALVLYGVADYIALLPGQEHWAGADLGGVILAILTYGLLIYWLRRRVRSFTANVTPPDDNTPLANRPLKDRLRDLLPGVAILAVVQTISTTLVTTGVITESANEQALDAMMKGNEAVMALTTVLLAPIVEELIFRGLLMNVMFTQRTRATQTFNVILSIGAFSMAHGPTTVVDFLIYAALGSAFALTYTKTRDLRCGIALHILNNAVAMFI